MLEDKGGQNIVLKKKRKLGNAKAKAVMAVFIMLASALIVSGSAWICCDDDSATGVPTYRLAWQIGDVECNSYCSPWDEFGLIKATPYERNFRVGQAPELFPRKTAPHCQGYPNKVNIVFCTELFTEAIIKFRYSPGYSGCELIEIYLDGQLLDTFCDEGGFDANNFCTFKMVDHEITLLCNPVDQKHHVLTILHKCGDGAFWDYIQLFLKDYSGLCCEKNECCECCYKECYCKKDTGSYICEHKCCSDSCPTEGCCYYVPGCGSQPIASHNYYGCKQLETGYIPPS
jgi:hypothetical protein